VLTKGVPFSGVGLFKQGQWGVRRVKWDLGVYGVGDPAMIRKNVGGNNRRGSEYVADAEKKGRGGKSVKTEVLEKAKKSTLRSRGVGLKGTAPEVAKKGEGGKCWRGKRWEIQE